jgi:uncharacterized membrane protein YgdD (TMEM256/DUF423 family)
MRSDPEKVPHRWTRRAPIYLATALLWLATSALGLAAVYYLHALAILLYDLVGAGEFRVGILIGQVVTLIAALLWLGLVVYSGELHLKHAGERRSWKWGGWMLAVELVIVIAGVVVTRA